MQMKPVQLAQELPLLPAAELDAEVDVMQELQVSVNGVTYYDVRLVRAFPLSAEGQYIVLLDGEDEEVGIIEDLADCKPEVEQLLQEILRNAYLVPRIAKINSITQKGLVPVWDVETDRGRRVFEVRSRRDVLMIGTRISIRDADGNRYEIIDYTELDLLSRRLLEREV
jgi:hypothetical protein